MRVDKKLTAALGAAAVLPQGVSASNVGPASQVSHGGSNSALSTNARIALSGGSQPARDP